MKSQSTPTSAEKAKVTSSHKRTMKRNSFSQWPLKPHYFLSRYVIIRSTLFKEGEESWLFLCQFILLPVHFKTLSSSPLFTSSGSNLKVRSKCRQGITTFKIKLEGHTIERQTVVQIWSLLGEDFNRVVIKYKYGFYACSPWRADLRRLYSAFCILDWWWDFSS